MTKQDVIKAAYGIDFENMKDFIDENGWCRNRKICGFFTKLKTFQKHPMVNYWFRPLSLKNIENNNGWFNVDLETDLPVNKIECHFIDKYSIIYLGFYHPIAKEFRSGNRCFEFQEISHYSAIEKPNLPVY